MSRKTIFRSLLVTLLVAATLLSACGTAAEPVAEELAGSVEIFS